MKILIVGDDQIGTKLMRALLEGAGHRVFTAEDGMEAVLFLDRAESVDLIISDINMPHINGFTLLTMVRRHKRYFSIPFFVHTACFTEHSHERLAYDLGANCYLRKSGHNAPVLQAVNELISA